MNENIKKELQSAAFERLIEHLRERKDVQNLDLMNLAGFCRNCLSKWFREEAEKKGFEINDKRLRRAGLDYKELAQVYEYENFDDYLDKANPSKLYFVSTKVSKSYADIKYISHDSFLFGSETKGLPKEIMDEYEGITVPMQDGSRSLNLSNCVSIVAYEAWRQLGFIN